MIPWRLLYLVGLNLRVRVRKTVRSIRGMKSGLMLLVLAGYLTYRWSGGSLLAAVGAAWIVCAFVALGLLLLCVRAFGRFDVSQETIER